MNFAAHNRKPVRFMETTKGAEIIAWNLTFLDENWEFS
jgi:hypothetical protein